MTKTATKYVEFSLLFLHMFMFIFYLLLLMFWLFTLEKALAYMWFVHFDFNK